MREGIAGLLALSQDNPPAPPPLTEEQRTKISRLANETQMEATRLKALLEERQRELIRVYAEYDLDEKRATKIEDGILDIQRQMLANYRKMQVGLRALVGRDRFLVLRKRLDRMLHPPPDKAPAKDKQPNQRP